MQSRRPATLLPSSRRAPRECQKPCSVVRFGRENLLFRFCLGLVGLPCFHLYYVMAITARAKFIPCRARCSKPGHPRVVTVVSVRGGGARQWARGPGANGRVGSDDGDFHRKDSDLHRKNKGLTPGEVLARSQVSVCIVGVTWPTPGVHQPDPPGLIHDDPRLLPPWRGSSSFPAQVSRLARQICPGLRQHTSGFSDPVLRVCPQGAPDRLVSRPPVAQSDRHDSDRRRAHPRRRGRPGCRCRTCHCCRRCPDGPDDDTCPAELDGGSGSDRRPGMRTPLCSEFDAQAGRCRSGRTA